MSLRMRYVENWGRLGMKYKEYSLADLATIKYGKNQKKVLSDTGEIPIYGTGGLMGYATESLYDKPSVLIGRKGTIGKVKYVDRPFWTVDTLFYTIINTDIVLPKYLYYVMSLIDLNSYNEGTTIPSLRTETLNRLIFNIPSIEDQEKVLSCILPIDEKIELNDRINENLEQQAQAIFKSWFVDFEPFNGEMPHDWIVSRLGDIASIKTNSFSPVKNPDAQLEHYSIPAYDEQKYPVFESAAGVKSNKYILSKNSVMISKLNPDTKRVWRPMCLSELAVSSTEFIIFEAFNPAYRDFVFSIIDSAAFSDWMCAHTTGSTNSRQRTTPSATLEFQVAFPDEKTITDFCAIVTQMYDTIALNICENQMLAQLRDSILPKLMSGELDVSNLNL